MQNKEISMVFISIDGIENGQTVGSLYHMEYTTGGSTMYEEWDSLV